MRKQLLLLVLGAIVMSIGTGLYTLAPSTAYIGVLMAIPFVLLNQRFARSPLKFIEPNMIYGFLLFNAFFVLHSLFYSLEARIYFIHVISLGLFIFLYAVGKMILFNGSEVRSHSGETHVTFLVLGALTVLLIGQLVQVFGYIDRPESGLDEQGISLTLRPGGFQNPNTTAGIALVFLFIAERLNRVKSAYLVLIALSLTSTIILLSQSRAAIIVLVFFVVFLIFKKKLLSFVVLGASLALLIGSGVVAYQEELIELVDATVLRFSGDTSSSDRLYLMRSGLAAFSEAPVLGNGYRYLTLSLGFSAHNEIIENLVNFGTLGVVVIGLAFCLLYLPASLFFLLVCVVPTFVFSHNFFETAAFQAVLGLALSIDRVKNDTLELSQK